MTDKINVVILDDEGEAEVEEQICGNELKQLFKISELIPDKFVRKHPVKFVDSIKRDLDNIYRKGY